jgi:hypothetical protein
VGLRQPATSGKLSGWTLEYQSVNLAQPIDEGRDASTEIFVRLALVLPLSNDDFRLLQRPRIL